MLTPGGHLLLGFHVGDERLAMTTAYGHTVSCDAYLFSPDCIAELAGQAGLTVHAQLLRQPEGREKRPQACVLARRPMSP